MKELDEASQGYKKESTEWIYNKSGTQNCFQVEFVVRPKGVIIYYTTKVQTQKGGNLSVLDKNRTHGEQYKKVMFNLSKECKGTQP